MVDGPPVPVKGSQRMKPRDWAKIKPDQVCLQGAKWREKFGTHIDNGVEYCCSCGGFVDDTHEDVIVHAEERSSSSRHVRYQDRTAEWRRNRNHRMVDDLRMAGSKWNKALMGDRFATFSIVGTSDWEDYASASLLAMLLETTSDVEERLARSEDDIREVVRLLTEIRDALVPRRGTTD